MFETYPDLLSVRELQDALGVGRTIAYHLVKSEKINHLRIGKSIKISKPYLLEYVRNSCYDKSITAAPPS